MAPSNRRTITGAHLPVQTTYPGVYIASVPATPPTDATAITAFLGRVPSGPLDDCLSAFSFAEFTRIYGGLAVHFPLTYAVRDFFANGGGQAIIVRLYEPSPTAGDGFATLTFSTADGSSSPTPLRLLAASPGTWGNRLRASVDTNGITDLTSAQFAPLGLTRADLFHLTVEYLDEDNHALVSERYLNVSTKPDTAGQTSRFLAHMLASQSALCRVAASPSDPPLNGAAATGTLGHDGDPLSEAIYLGDRTQRTGLYRLDQVESFNLLCIPPDRGLDAEASPGQRDLPPAVHLAAATYCTGRRAMYLVDPPTHWETLASQGRVAEINPDDLGIHGQDEAGNEVARNAAVYFPRYFAPDPLRDNLPCAFAPSGIVAGVIAATDLARGVWKSPAGLDARLAGVEHLSVTLDGEADGTLNSRGINCLRAFPVIGPVIWGGRTLRGADAFQDDYQYLPVRRLVLFIEDSLFRLTRWAVFEPNDESLWSALRLCVDQFLANLARQGALYNYSVACGLGTTMTATDILNGNVYLQVAIAPTKPAEFLLIAIRQQVQTPA